MSAQLLEVGEGDEFIVPSYTFVSSVNAFALRKAHPVFIDIREDTLNMDERLLESVLTPATKAIVPVHYAGVGCEMRAIVEFAAKHGLAVVEDAAQGIDAFYEGIPLGTMGHLGTLSFHETKNIQCGEGGALIINEESFIERAEIIREKGTNRSKFFRGEVDKYSWVDCGSSYLPSDMLAAFLFAQLEMLESISAMRRRIFDYYFEALQPLEEEGLLRLPRSPAHTDHNSHMFYVLFPAGKTRDRVMTELKSQGIHAIFHYIPLHSSPMGQQLGYREADLPVTERISRCILRLPFYNGITIEELDRVIESIYISVGARVPALAG